MPEWTTILCGIDESDASRVAMRDAASLARHFGAGLTLIHVFPPPAVSGLAVDMLAPPPRELTEQLAREYQPMMARWKAEAERLSGRTVSTSLVAGDPAEEIVRFASERGFSLIVLASRGRTGLKRLLLGSVAKQVVRDAKCSVLVARPPDDAR